MLEGLGEGWERVTDLEGWWHLGQFVTAWARHPLKGLWSPLSAVPGLARLQCISFLSYPPSSSICASSLHLAPVSPGWVGHEGPAGLQKASTTSGEESLPLLRRTGSARPLSYLVSRRCVVLGDSSGGYWVIPVLRIPECRGVGDRAGARGAVLAYLSLYVGNTVPWCPQPGHPYSLSALGQVLQILQPLHLLPAPADILHQDVVLGWREHTQQIYTASQFLMSFSWFWCFYCGYVCGKYTLEYLVWWVSIWDLMFLYYKLTG